MGALVTYGNQGYCCRSRMCFARRSSIYCTCTTYFSTIIYIYHICTVCTMYPSSDLLAPCELRREVLKTLRDPCYLPVLSTYNGWVLKLEKYIQNVKHTFKMSMHACILHHHNRPNNVWLYILNVCFTFLSLQWCLSTAQAHICTFSGHIHKTCHVKYVGCFISWLNTVRTLIRSTFRMYIHSKCIRLISGLTCSCCLFRQLCQPFYFWPIIL